MCNIHNWNEWIGTDEAGKGDYFGPLVVAGVYMNNECRDEFIEMGITDGKKISNQRIRRLAAWMREHYKEHIFVRKMMPHPYNSLYNELRADGKNSHTILARMHVDVIETLATRTETNYVLVDKFSKKDILTPLLKKQDVALKLENNAERDIAVAAASVIARDTFLTSIELLSDQYELKLPRGAYRVTDAGREFVKLHGAESLQNVAKLHFRTTEDVLA